MSCSLGHDIRSENRISLWGSFASRSTRSKITSPEARLSAVSTESVSRAWTTPWPPAGRRPPRWSACAASPAWAARRSWIVSPLTRARLNPWDCRLRNSSMYSPLRPRMTGASTWKRVPSSSWSTRSTICCGVCRSIGDAAHGAVRAPGAGVEQPQVVVDLGDRADGRARVLRRGLLVDRHGRAQALDEVDVGLVHLAEELPGVRRERLDVAALALGEDRVEGQARLAGAGEPGEHDQGVAGQVERDVLEVVLARAPDDELVSHESSPWIGVNSVSCDHWRSNKCSSILTDRQAATRGVPTSNTRGP